MLLNDPEVSERAKKSLFQFGEEATDVIGHRRGHLTCAV